MTRGERPSWEFDIEWRQEDLRVYKTAFGLGSLQTGVFDGQKNISLQIDYGQTITIFGVILTPASTMTLTPPSRLALDHLDHLYQSNRSVPAATLDLVSQSGRRFEYKPRAAHSISLTPVALTSYVHLNVHFPPDARYRRAGLSVWVRYEFHSSPPPERVNKIKASPERLGGFENDKKLFDWSADVTRAVRR